MSDMPSPRRIWIAVLVVVILAGGGLFAWRTAFPRETTDDAQIAGHVHVGDHAILGGFTVVHQFVSIGAHSITAMGTILLQDLPPYVMAAGNTATPYGINAEGLKRRGFSPQALASLRGAYKTLYKSGLTLVQAKEALALQAQEAPEVGLLVDFLARARRGIIR